MLLQNVTMPLYYEAWLGGSQVNAIKLASVLLAMAEVAIIMIGKRKPETLKVT